MMKRLTLFLIAAGLFGSVLLVEWSCSRDGSFLEANPASSTSSAFSAKAGTSYNPFNGLDEPDTSPA